MGMRARNRTGLRWIARSFAHETQGQRPPHGPSLDRPSTAGVAIRMSPIGQMANNGSDTITVTQLPTVPSFVGSNILIPRIWPEFHNQSRPGPASTPPILRPTRQANSPAPRNKLDLCQTICCLTGGLSLPALILIRRILVTRPARLAVPMSIRSLRQVRACLRGVLVRRHSPSPSVLPALSPSENVL